MTAGSAHARDARSSANQRAEAPLVWTFDGSFARCLADMEDTLRRAIVQLGDVSRIAVGIDIRLPALKRRVEAGDALQPAWTEFMRRISSRYGLPSPPMVRYLRRTGPLASLVIAYRS